MSRAPKLVHFGWGVLLLHAVKRHFRGAEVHALQEDLDANRLHAVQREQARVRIDARPRQK